MTGDVDQNIDFQMANQLNVIPMDSIGVVLLLVGVVAPGLIATVGIV